NVVAVRMLVQGDHPAGPIEVRRNVERQRVAGSLVHLSIFQVDDGDHPLHRASSRAGRFNLPRRGVRKKRRGSSHDTVARVPAGRRNRSTTARKTVGEKSRPTCPRPGMCTTSSSAANTRGTTRLSEPATIEAKSTFPARPREAERRARSAESGRSSRPTREASQYALYVPR